MLTAVRPDYIYHKLMFNYMKRTAVLLCDVLKGGWEKKTPNKLEFSDRMSHLLH